RVAADGAKSADEQLLAAHEEIVAAREHVAAAQAEAERARAAAERAQAAAAEKQDQLEELRAELEEAQAAAADAGAGAQDTRALREQAEALRIELAQVSAERDVAIEDLERARQAAAGTPAAEAAVPAASERTGAAARAVQAIVLGTGAASDLLGALRMATAPLAGELGWDAVVSWQAQDGIGGASARCAGVTTDPNLGLWAFESASWGATLGAGGGIAAGVLQGGDVQWIADTSASDEPRLKEAAAAGLSSGAVVPVRGPEGVLGVLEVYSQEQRAADPEALAALAAVAAVLGRIGHLLTQAGKPRWGLGKM
ncbi:MAG TPA: GAF domain-containing protein, partial [Solirubrobacteraceae bacterium]|nr:GAF domain-containing protein [Solirubrobacteraceae bacterium]